MGVSLLIIPLMAVLAFLFAERCLFLHGISIIASALMMIMAVFATKDVITFGKLEYACFGGFFYLDYLSIIVLDIVLLICFLSALYSVQYLEKDNGRGKLDNKKMKIYYILMYLFLFTMVLSLTVNNMGIMWIAIEATTLASVFLVGFSNDKYALEAAWKYIIICSVGIALAMLGIIFIHLSSTGVLRSTELLDWSALMENAKDLNEAEARLAFLFILVGFGTKAGLAPLHTWLPDAHSQAPSPISALLSGVLLNSAMYGIIRITAVVNKCLGSSIFTGRLLIAMGMLSIVTAAVFIMTQRDYKRLLAYSSIEHMGVIAVAIGFFTPLSVFSGLLHMINHSLTKSMLFFCSGNILQKYGTKHISKIKGVLNALPFSGTAFFIGLFAIGGTPPFSVFLSELGILMAIFNGRGYLVGVALAMLFVFIFSGIAVALFRIFFKADNGHAEDIDSGEINMPGVFVILFLLLVISFTGLKMPEAVVDLIFKAQSIIIGV